MSQYQAITLSNVLQENVSPKDVILDLGPFASGTTEAFLKKKCRCFVEDIPELIEELNESNLAPSEQAFKQHLMVLDQDVKFDVILVWDLFHYLSLDSIRILFKLLSDKIKSSTLLHAMRYTGDYISSRPAIFKFNSDFSYERFSAENVVNIPNNPHPTVKLLMQIEKFELDNTLMDRVGMEKGMTEFLLKCSGGSYSTKNKVAKKGKAADLMKSLAKQSSSIELPNLNKQFERFKKMPASSILDATPSQSSHTNFLSKITNKLIQQDLYTKLNWLKKTGVNRDSSLGQKTLLFDAKTKLDLVLLWDLFNFCSTQQIIEIGERLALYLDRKSHIHIVLARTGGAPFNPTEFYFESQLESLEIKMLGSINGEQPRAIKTTRDLVHLLPQYRVAAYYLGTLPNGENYQEFLFSPRC